MTKKYAIDEASFNPATKGRTTPYRGAPSSSAPGRMAASDIPEELRPIFKKYPSLSAVVKSNDTDVLKQVVEFLKTRPDFSEQELSVQLVKNAATLTPAMAQALLDLGATLEELHERMDPVFIAAEGKNKDLVMFFIEQGHVPVSHTRGDGVPLLVVALRQESYDLGEALLAAGADINQTSSALSGKNAALHHAAANGSFQSVIWLIERGANAALANLDQKWPCQMVPEVDEQSQMWDMDCMYETLKEYAYKCEAALAIDPKAKVEFEIPVRMREMAYLESTPMTQMEAMAEAMKQQMGGGPENTAVEGILPKAKKMGF
jgi:hypothetical protein